MNKIYRILLRIIFSMLLSFVVACSDEKAKGNVLELKPTMSDTERAAFEYVELMNQEALEAVDQKMASEVITVLHRVELLDCSSISKTKFQCEIEVDMSAPGLGRHSRKAIVFMSHSGNKWVMTEDRNDVGNFED